MNCIQISKEDGSTYPLYFTETELEQIYHSAINLKLKKDLIKKGPREFTIRVTAGCV